MNNDTPIRVFVKEGQVHNGFMSFETLVRIEVAHGEDYYFFYPKKGTRHVLSGKESTRRPKNRKLYHSTGNWFIARWQYETICADGSKAFWNPDKEILERVSDKEEIELLLSEKEIITEVFLTKCAA